jgi:hypothetical protein
MKKAILVAMSLIGLGIVACKKDKAEVTPPATSAELLMSATWKIDTIGFDMNKDGTLDSEVPGGLKPCEMDNTLDFTTDSTGKYDEGALKCNTTDPQTIDFTWQLKDNDKVINIQGLPGELNGDINILTLNDSALVMSKNITVTFPVPFNANLIISLQK